MRTASLASTLELKSLRFQCMEKALKTVLMSPNPLDEFKAFDAWDSLSFGDYHTLVMAMAKAFTDSKDDRQLYKIDSDNYVRQFSGVGTASGSFAFGSFGSTVIRLPKFKPEDAAYCRKIISSLSKDS